MFSALKKTLDAIKRFDLNDSRVFLRKYFDISKSFLLIKKKDFLEAWNEKYKGVFFEILKRFQKLIVTVKSLAQQFILFSVSFLKSKVWPVIKTSLTLSLFLLFLLGAYFLVGRGLHEALGREYQSLIETITQTIGTITAIFFSLILIPLNQISTRYSPSFLKYLAKDKIFLFTFFFSAVVLLYNTFLLFFGASQYLVIVSIVLFIQLIAILIALVLHIFYLANPYNSILLPAHADIVGSFRKWIPRYYKACKKTSTKLLSQAGIAEELDLCSLKVDAKITDYIQTRLLPIREVAIKSIRDLDLEQAQNAVQTMMSVVVHYLYARRNYYSDDEPLLYFLYTEYKLIAQTGSNELKIRLHTFLVECWRQVGIQAAKVNVKKLQRIGNNFNFLVNYPVEGLKDLCILNMTENDSYAPGKACEALADIGVTLMSEGYDQQAAEIIEKLEQISLLADAARIRNVAGSANYAIMRIYGSGVYRRNSGSIDDLNFPYRKINKSVDRLLEAILATPRNVNDNMVLSSFIGWDVDPIKGVNLAKIAEYGIFAPELTAFSLEMNLECVRANIKALDKALELLRVQQEQYFSQQAIEILYRIQFFLLSYVNNLMAEDHVLHYQQHPLINEDLRDTAREIFLESIEILCKLVKEKVESYLFERSHLNILFSLYLVVLYENKIRPCAELDDLFNSFHTLLVTLLNDYGMLPGTSGNDDTYKYFRLAKVVLAENGFTDLANDFDVPPFDYSSGSMFGHQSQYPKTIFDGRWIIKRPIFQVNTYYYNKIEQALRLDTLNFY